MINPNNLCPGCMNEKVTEGKCPICGYNPDEPVNPAFLAPGYVLEDRFSIGKAFENNSEGITYLGYDLVTSTVVNIREFYPSGLCERESDGYVIVNEGCEAGYNDALAKYIELSRKLFRLNGLPALFDVLDVREANGTAYRIIRSVTGISLREFLMRNGGILKWDQARSLFAPLIPSISSLHKAGIIHRGISPDTIIVGKDGKLRLSGFCIAETRTATGSLTSQLFPGFAAVEQYGRAGTQGTWTDVYAFAATIYRTLVGNPPPEAIERLDNDNMTIPAKVAHETPKIVLETLANALQVLPSDRTQNIEEMRKGLAVSSQAAAPVPSAVAVPKAVERPVARPAAASSKTKKKKGSAKMYGLVAGIVTAFLLAIIVFFVLWITGLIGGSDDASNASGNGLVSSIGMQSQSSKTQTSEVEQKYSVLPSFVGLRFSDVAINHAYADLSKFKIKTMEYSDTYSVGEIISQTPASATAVENNTTVEVVVSLGSYTIPMIDVYGTDKDSATLQLLIAGFKYNNILFEYRLDDTKAPGVVIETDPKAGTAVNLETRITVTLNSYQGNPAVNPSGGNDNTSSSGTDSKNRN